MLTFKVETTLGEPQKGSQPNGYANLQRGMAQALLVIQAQWTAAVYGQQLPGMSYRLRNRAYADSISSPQAIRYPDGSLLIGAVVSNYKHARDIEHGYGPFDLKPGLLAGPKARTIKEGKNKGKKYTIVGLRHVTPGNPGSSGGFATQMPRSVYDVAKRIRGFDEISNKQLKGIDARHGTSYAQPATNWAGYTHQSPIYEGLGRWGAERHYQYLTFRTVHSDSDARSWMYPAKPPNPVMQAVIAKVRPDIQQILTAALKRDLWASLGH